MTTTINNEHKKLNVPNLRFPEFQGEWEMCKLENVMNFSTTRVSSSELNEDNYVSTENMLQDFLVVTFLFPTFVLTSKRFGEQLLMVVAPLMCLFCKQMTILNLITCIML